MPKTAFILGHANDRPGSIGVLLRYLESKNYDIKLLLHPFDDYASLDTVFTAGGQSTTYPRRPKGLFNLIGDFWLSLKILRRENYDIFIGTTNFDTLPAVICRKLLRSPVPYILYYPRDYREDRYPNPLLNQIYYFVESIAVRNSDLTASNTMRAASRRAGHGLKLARSLVVPNPVRMTNPQFKPKTIRKDHFIYQGDVTREHGLFDLIAGIAPLIRKLVVIGNGPDWDRTVALARSAGLELELHRAKTPAFVSDYLEDFAGIGLAPYNLASKWTFYASPLKIGDYITAGVPVLMSDVPEIAAEVQRDGLGIVYRTLDLGSLKRQIDAFDSSGFHAKARAFYAKNNTNARLAALPL